MDDFTADITTTGVLSPDGTAIVGNIDFIGDDDWFELTVTESQALQINLTRGSLNDPFLRLYDSNGDLLASNNNFGSFDSRLNFDFVAGDTYYVSARAADNGTGTYELTTSTLEDDFTADVNTTGVLSADGTDTVVNIDFAGDEDWFALEVLQGEAYIINFTPLNSRADIALHDSNGSFRQGTNTDAFSFLAHTTETLYISASLSFFRYSTNTGSYELTANIVEDDFGSNVYTTGVLSTDGTATLGTINFAGDKDWFALEVIQGNIYTINFTSSTLTGPDIELRDSNGAFIVDGSFPNTDLSFIAQTTGTVYISASIFGDATGSYELTANTFQDDFTADVNTTGVLNVDGTAVIGNIEIENDEDWFALEVIQGELYDINIVSSLNGADIALHDSNGSFLQAGNDVLYGSDALSFTAQTTGTVYISVDVLTDATGSYELTANIDDFTADVTTTGILNADGSAVTGNIDFENDVDWFALEVIQGQDYIINFTGLSDPDVELYDSNGAFLQDGNDVLLFTAQTTGTVYVSADDFFLGTGSYELTANILEDDFAADVTTTGVLSADGTAVTGNIDFENDVDWFALEVIQGEDYIINFTGLSDPDVELYDSNGSFLQDGNDVLSFTAQTTGTVYVSADVFFLGTGSYELTAIEILNGEAGDDVLVGGSGSDIINGFEGNDNLTGLASDDILNGDAGNDIIDGGTGEDIIDGGSGDDTLRGNGDNDTINGGVGKDSISAGVGNDMVHGGGNNDTLLGQGGDDILFGDGGADTLRGGSGNDTLHGGDARDILFGQGNNDILYGEGGNDTLSGAGGIDQLFGGAGNDNLNGGMGADRLDGGSGNDILNGGGADGARDTFVFAEGYDQDRINGFDQAGNDRIELDDALWAAAVTLTAQEVVDMFGSLNGTGSILTLDFGNGDILEVQNAAGIDMDTFGADILVI